MAIVIKISFKDDIRRISFENKPSFQELAEKIYQIYRIQTFKLQYVDEEGDLITIGTDFELSEAINFAKDSSSRVLKMVITSNEEPNLMASFLGPIESSIPNLVNIISKPIIDMLTQSIQSMSVAGLPNVNGEKNAFNEAESSRKLEEALRSLLEEEERSKREDQAKEQQRIEEERLQERKRREEEERKRIEEERKRLEQEHKRREEEERKRIEEERNRIEEERRRERAEEIMRRDEEQKRIAEEKIRMELRLIEEQDRKRKEDEEERNRIDQERKRLEEERKRREEEERKRIEEELRREVEEQQRIEEERRRIEDEKRKEEERRKFEEEQKRKAIEEERRVQEERQRAKLELFQKLEKERQEQEAERLRKVEQELILKLEEERLRAQQSIPINVPGRGVNYSSLFQAKLVTQFCGTPNPTVNVPFLVVWTVKNTGEVPWGVGVTLREFHNNPNIKTINFNWNVRPLNVGESLDLPVNLSISKAGEYLIQFSLVDASGRKFGDSLEQHLFVSAPAPPAVVIPHAYRATIDILHRMGFNDDDLNLSILDNVNGDLNQAIPALLDLTKSR